MIDGYIEVPRSGGFCHGCVFYEEHIKCYGIDCTDVIYKRKEKTMTKADLKTGMETHHRNGTIRRVALNSDVGDILVLESWYGFLYFEALRDNLTYNEDSNYDIVKVYSRLGALLWERSESAPEEMIYLDEMGEVSKSTIKEALKAKFNREA